MQPQLFETQLTDIAESDHRATPHQTFLPAFKNSGHSIASAHTRTSWTSREWRTGGRTSCTSYEQEISTTACQRCRESFVPHSTHHTRANQLRYSEHLRVTDSKLFTSVFTTGGKKGSEQTQAHNAADIRVACTRCRYEQQNLRIRFTQATCITEQVAT